MGEHTPGDWTLAAEQLGHGHQGKLVIVVADERGIEYGVIVIAEVSEKQVTHEAAVANGRLMEKAPKLAGVLRKIVLWDDDEGSLPADVDLPDLIEEARVLLQEIEGD